MMTGMFINQLTVIDFTVYTGLLLRGQSATLNVFIEGRQDIGGMILDFGKIKPALKNICDSEVDHRLICNKKHVELNNAIGIGSFPVKYGIIETSGPIDMYCLLENVSENYTASIENYLTDKFKKAFPEYLFKIDIQFHKNADFHYNHGLKYHDGNCQRIIHGHSSEIDILVNGTFCDSTKAWIKKYLDDKFFYNSEDLREDETNKHRYSISYPASQGRFSARIPKELVEAIDGEPSIENISKHISILINVRNGPAKTLSVRVTEGIAKGAVTRSGI